MFSTKRLAFVACALCAVTARAETPKLTLDDIDQIARTNVVKSMTGGDSKGVPGAAAQVPAVAPAPASASAAVAPHPMVHVVHADPVTFVGAYRDEHGGAYVLYDFNGSVYPGRVGSPLLNGWTARKVDGFRVTVSEGSGKNARTWTETIKTDYPPVQDSSPNTTRALQAINDLGSPLPPGGPVGVAPVLAR